MGVEYNERVKGGFLGTSLYKAQHRLTRNILFNLVQQLGQDNCFRCGKKIQTVDELSIEHKEPWLHVSVDLFWNQSNIAFSHKRCNRPHRYNTKGRAPPKRNGPEGTAWCGQHQIYLPIDDFASNKSKWNGLQTNCRSCISRLRKEYRRRR